MKVRYTERDILLQFRTSHGSDEYQRGGGGGVCDADGGVNDMKKNEPGWCLKQLLVFPL